MPIKVRHVSFRKNKVFSSIQNIDPKASASLTYAHLAGKKRTASLATIMKIVSPSSRLVSGHLRFEAVEQVVNL